METWRNRLYTSAAEPMGEAPAGIPAAYRMAQEPDGAGERRAQEPNRRRLKNGRAEIVYQPALTPLEAAMIPAQDRRPIGALAHLRRSWRPGRTEARVDALQHLAGRRFIGRRSASDRRGPLR